MQYNWKGDRPEALPAVGAVDLRRLVEIVRYSLQSSQENDRHERRVFPDVDKYQGNLRTEGGGQRRCVTTKDQIDPMRDQPELIVEHPAECIGSDDRRNRPRYEIDRPARAPR